LLWVAILAIPMAAPLAWPAGVRAAQGELPTARVVVDRFIAAIGGVAAFDKVTSEHAIGTVSYPAGGQEGTIELYAARPNKSLLLVDLKGFGKFQTGYDGKVGWSIDPQSGPSVATGQMLSEMAEGAIFDSPMRKPDQIKEMTTVEKTIFEGHPAYKLRIVYPSGREEFSYFDVETALELGHEGKRTTAMGVLPSTELLRDYTQFGGLKQPATIVTRLMVLEQIAHFDSFEYNTVPATTFDLPPAIKALIAK
jgi:hypothetical protein